MIKNVYDMVKTFVTLFLAVSIFLSIGSPLTGKEPPSLIVNIISHSLNNGAGKEIDVSVLKEEFQRLGHVVNLFDYYEVKDIEEADINVFLAQFIPAWFVKAKLNWFVPNAEFCDATLSDLQNFDLVLCKTEECFRIFKPISKKAYYLGFTSLDRSQPLISKDFSRHVHVAGKSHMKGTEKIIKAWRSHPKLPNLILIWHRPTQKIMGGKNLKIVNKRISDHSLLNLQNRCGIHLCPSKTEGFGHYIMEAMSIGAVVITTDAPPMNEFIKDQRCLVDYQAKRKKNYATTYIVDEKHLVDVVQRLQRLSNEELNNIGQQNREEYLRRKEDFKKRFEKLMNKTVKALS